MSPRPRTSWPRAASSSRSAGEVVELAVEDGDDVAGLVRDRLVAELGVEHLEPLVAEHAGAEGVGRALVGAAVSDARPHVVDELGRRLSGRRIESADPAHAPHSAFHAVAIVSCHLEQPLRDETWARFDALQRRRPGGFDVIALMRPPDAAHGEDEAVWLERARAAAARGPFGLHTHWTSPTHARPTGGDPAARVRDEAEWMRERGLEPTFFCGGGWYTDDDVRRTVAELGLVDCTVRGASRRPGVLPTTHSLGALARGVLGPLPPLRPRVLPRLRPARPVPACCARCRARGARGVGRPRDPLALRADSRRGGARPALAHTIAALVATKPLVGGAIRRRTAPATTPRHPPRLSADIRRPGCFPRPRSSARWLASRRSASPRSSSSTCPRLAGALYLALVLRELYYGERPILWGLPWDAEAKWLPFLTLVTVLVFWRAGLYARARAARRRRADRLVAPARHGDHARLRGRHRLPAHDVRPLRHRVRPERAR